MVKLRSPKPFYLSKEHCHQHRYSCQYYPLQEPQPRIVLKKIEDGIYTSQAQQWHSEQACSHIGYHRILPRHDEKACCTAIFIIIADDMEYYHRHKGQPRSKEIVAVCRRILLYPILIGFEKQS